MKFIKLSNSKRKCIVDDEDFENVNQYKWYLNSRYIVHTFNHTDKVKIHHFIIGRALPPLETDHINRNPLDNRRSNLRIVTKAENNMNKDPKRCGVTWNKKAKKWQAQRERFGKTFYLGIFKTKKEAVQVAKFWGAQP